MTFLDETGTLSYVRVTALRLTSTPPHGPIQGPADSSFKNLPSNLL